MIFLQHGGFGRFVESAIGRARGVAANVDGIGFNEAPPSMRITPVMYAAAGDSRNTMALDTSASWAKRRSGVALIEASIRGARSPGHRCLVPRMRQRWVPRR